MVGVKSSCVVLEFRFFYPISPLKLILLAILFGVKVGVLQYFPQLHPHPNYFFQMGDILLLNIILIKFITNLITQKFNESILRLLIWIV